MKPDKDSDALTRKADWLLEHAQYVSARVSVAGLAPSLQIWHYPAWSPLVVYRLRKEK